MAEKTIVKVMKFELRYIDGAGEFSEMQKHLWELQKQTREVLNKTIQMGYALECKRFAHHDKTGQWLDDKELTGSKYKAVADYINAELKEDYNIFYSDCRNSTVRKAYKKFKDAKNKIFSGEMSLPSYRSNQPIIIHNRNVIIRGNAESALVGLKVFSDGFKALHGFPAAVNFKLCVKDGTQRAIIENVISEIYKISESQLIYDNKKWFLILAYRFTQKKNDLNPDKILGVDLGVKFAVYASSIGEYGSFRIKGGEVTEFIKRLEKRKKSLQNQATVCGDGRIGHGTKTRVADVYKARDKISNFQDTINHRYSRAIVDYARKNGYGTIQLEKLDNSIEKKGDYSPVLVHWTYYDLRTKMEYKAAEYGIKVIAVEPKYTSQRCSKCGYISSENRKTQESFECIKCGYKCNADFNASQNLSVRDIDRIIDEYLGANPELT
ncbi:MAG: transposase [Ruminococcaceae bacterium]|nr:transposase [Oscillospiraceae bacterium]